MVNKFQLINDILIEEAKKPVAPIDNFGLGFTDIGLPTPIITFKRKKVAPKISDPFPDFSGFGSIIPFIRKPPPKHKKPVLAPKHKISLIDEFSIGVTTPSTPEKVTPVSTPEKRMNILIPTTPVAPQIITPFSPPIPDKEFIQPKPLPTSTIESAPELVKHQPQIKVNRQPIYDRLLSSSNNTIPLLLLGGLALYALTRN